MGKKDVSVTLWHQFQVQMHWDKPSENLLNINLLLN